MSHVHHHLTSERYRLTLYDEAGTPKAGAVVVITAIHRGRDEGAPLFSGKAGEITYPIECQDAGGGYYDYLPPAENGFEKGQAYFIVATGSFDTPEGEVQAHLDAVVYCR